MASKTSLTSSNLSSFRAVEKILSKNFQMSVKAWASNRLPYMTGTHSIAFFAISDRYKLLTFFFSPSLRQCPKRTHIRPWWQIYFYQKGKALFSSTNSYKPVTFLMSNVFFLLLFGCLTVNFGPLLRGQPHSSYFDHCVLSLWFWPRSTGAS